MSFIPSMTPDVSFRFDRFELFPASGQLRKQGTLVHLAPQPFRVLMLLIQRAGQIVTREEIQAELWSSDTFVSFEQSTNAAIRRIRFALNDRAETPRFLRTFPRRGYSFIAPVERIVAAPPPQRTVVEAPREASRTLPRWLIPTARIALALTTASALLFATGRPMESSRRNVPKVVRVAISEIVPDDRQSEVERQLLATELRTRLGQYQPERVLLTAPGEGADVRIETSVRGNASGLSAEARLTEVWSGRELWSETFRGSGEPGDLALEVAVRVTRALVDLRLPAVRRESPPRADVPESVLALYREGRMLQKLPPPQRNCDRALELFEKSVSLEPRFHEAWSAMGDIWTERTFYWRGLSRKMAIANARAKIERALALDPAQAVAINNQAVLAMYFDHALNDAERGLRRAIALDPDYPDAHINLAVLLTAMGRHAEASSEMRKAKFLDPPSSILPPLSAYLHLMSRRYDDARAEYRAAMLLRYGEGLHWDMMSAALGASRWHDAARSLSAILGEPIGISRDARNPGAELGIHLHRLAEQLASNERNDVDPYTQACFFAQARDADRAFAALDRAAIEQSLNLMFAFVDPRLDPIRDDPRFADRLDQFGLVH